MRRIGLALAGAALIALAIGVWLTRPKLSEHPGAPAPDAVVAHVPPPSPAVTSSATAVPSPIPSAAPPIVAGKAATQLHVLNEIFATRNDNDPRMDTELRHLDEQAKAAFRARYRALPPEMHNERGTIVFLLGRNLTTPEDYAFFKDVFNEPPCLSPMDCSHVVPPDANDDHHGGGTEIVLLYPQLTALKAMQQTSPATPELRAAANNAWAAARASRSPVVAKYAEKLQPTR